MAELSPEAKAEIDAAARILRSDGFHIHRTYPAFKAAQEKAEAEAKNNPPTTEGGPPPVKENPEPEYEEIVGLWGTKRIPKKKKADGPPPAV